MISHQWNLRDRNCCDFHGTGEFIEFNDGKFIINYVNRFVIVVN